MGKGWGRCASWLERQKEAKYQSQTAINRQSHCIPPGVIFQIILGAHTHHHSPSASSWVKHSAILGRRGCPSETFSLTMAVFCIANPLGIWMKTRRIVIVQISRHGTRPKFPNLGHLTQIWSPNSQCLRAHDGANRRVPFLGLRSTSDTSRCSFSPGARG